MALTDLIVLESMLRPKLGKLVFDMSLTEDHSVENDITASPVARQSNKSDHVITRPRRLVMTGLISSQSATILGMVGNIADAFAGSKGRHITAWKRIVDMATKHDVISVYTTLEPYDNMIIKSARVMRTVDDSIEVMIDIRRVEDSDVFERFNVSDASADLISPDSPLGNMGSTVLNG